MISNKEINLEKTFYEELRRRLKNKYRGYPEGSICFRYEHGKHRAYWNHKGELTYIRRENNRLALRLIDKRIIEKKIKYIDNNLKILNKLQNSYKGDEIILGDGIIKEIESKVGNGFRINNFVKDITAKQPGKQASSFLDNKKIHTTPAGVVVRSKAELVIATFLEMKGIDYIYEKPLKLFLKTVAPDFTIKRKSDGKIIIWEHFGMMDDPEYYESRMEVLSDYHYAGWLPYENFIATFGERNSPIDMTVIETICETMLR